MNTRQPKGREMHAEAEEQDTFVSVVEAIDQQEVDPDRHLSIQLDQSMRDAIRAAQTSGQKASVTVVVKVHPSQERRMIFSATVKASLPRPPVQMVTLFADANGAVHRSDPAQQRLAFFDAGATRKQEI